MKTCVLVASLLIGSTLGARSQPAQSPGGSSSDANLPPPTAYAVVTAGPHSQVWQRTTYEFGPGGIVVPKLQSFTELQTCLNYFDPVSQQWTPSSDQISATATGGEVANCQTPVAFLGNLNSSGAVQLSLGNGTQLTSSISGLGYYDSSSSQSVVFAEIQNCSGEILPSGDQVLYTNAFDNISADVLFNVNVAGMEQFVILRTSLPSIANWNMNPATTFLQVYTEWFDPPTPVITPVQSDAGPDELLDFGTMQMGMGEAFAIGSEDDKVPVTKQWIVTEGRTVLVEQVPLQSVQAALSALPPATSGSGSISLPAGAIKRTASLGRALPTPKGVLPSTPSLKLAKSPLRGKGFVLDYTILSSETNLTLQSDSTYYVAGLVNIYGTLTCEKATVVKYSNSPAATLVATNVIWETSPFHPSIFTAKDDGTAGVPISGSTGNPTNYYGGVAVNLSGAAAGTISNVRFSYLSNALACASGTLIRDAQFVKCKSIVNNGSGTFSLENVLGWQLGGFQNVGCSSCSGITLTAQNATFDTCTNFLSNPSASSVYFTNCIVAQVTNWLAGTLATNTCAILSSDTGVFQTAGAGSHYLPTNSAYHDAGTTNIDPVLLADLAARTTYPPIVYSNVTFSIATNFSPQASRDAGNTGIDIGWHYCPIDYAFGGVAANSNFTFTAGTAAAWFEPPGYSYGIGMGNNVTNTFSGTATNPCYWVRYSTVQEGGNGLWQNKGTLGGITSINGNSGDPPQVNANFLHCGLLANDASDFEDDLNPMSVHANECEFTSGNIGGYGNSLYLTNCLFDRKYIAATCNCSPTVALRNCTLHGGTLLIQHWSGTTWPVWIENCAFDNTSISMDNYGGSNTNITYCDYNSFITNANLTAVLGPHCITNLLTFNWESGPLGNYYQPANGPDIQAGSVPATVVGLASFTVLTNQLDEGANTVSIGYAYTSLIVPPTITLQPTNQTVVQGTTATFSAAASGTLPLGYQWEFDGTNIAGATSTDLSLNNVQTTNAGNYTFIATNLNGAATSSVAALTVLVPPQITLQPTNQIITQGSSVTFSAAATGTSPLIYQWNFYGAAISGATNSSYTIAAAQFTDTGDYTLQVTNAAGSASSANAHLTAQAVGAVQGSFSSLSGVSDILPANSSWNVTDITDPNNPTYLGILPGPFGSLEGYGGYLWPAHAVPQINTGWHSTSVDDSPMFGTTIGGGTNGHGTIYVINEPNETPTNFAYQFPITIIHAFNGTDGDSPNWSLTLSGITLYGTTVAGGAYNNGTIFKVNIDGSGFTSLYSFENSFGSPNYGLIWSSNVLYGTAGQLIFRINTDGTDFAILADVPGGDDSGLTLSGSQLYGATAAPGTPSVLFSVNIDGTDYTPLHTNSATDGTYPTAGLVVSNGKLYGTANRGFIEGFSTNAGIGWLDATGYTTVFVYDTTTTNFNTIHTFTNAPDGSSPQIGSRLLLSGTNLFGTIIGHPGGSNGYIFETDINGTSFNTLHTFTGSGGDGEFPYGNVAILNGALYATTVAGGQNGQGFIYGTNLTPGGWSGDVYDFGASSIDGTAPYAGLIFQSPRVYGVAETGGTYGDGTVFSINQDGSDYKILHSFQDGTSDGNSPYWNLVLAGRTLYGTTLYGGPNDDGTVFAINIDGSGFNVLHSFSGSLDHPNGGLVISNHTLFGSTFSSIFSINTDGTGFTSLTNISGGPSGLALANGVLYGITLDDTPNSVFRVDIDGGAFATLHTFSSTTNPVGGLVVAFGEIYGTTGSGFDTGYGTVFQMDTNGNNFTNLYAFSDTQTFHTPWDPAGLDYDGAYPMSKPLLLGDTLYGATIGDTYNYKGSLYSIALTNGGEIPFAVLTNFTSASEYTNGAFHGAFPMGNLVAIPSSLIGGQVPHYTTLFGTTQSGGVYSNGTAFSDNLGDGTNGFVPPVLTNSYNLGQNGSHDSQSPYAGLTLSYRSSCHSVWSLDTTLTLTADETSEVSYSAAVDDDYYLYVNGFYIGSFKASGSPTAFSAKQNISAASVALYGTNVLHPGNNDLSVIITDGEEPENGYHADCADYFAMAISDDYMFGTTTNGGGYGYGTVFVLSQDGNPVNYNVIHSFNGSDGAYPYWTMVMSGTNLYGTTLSGGTGNCGTIFRVNTDGSVFSVLTNLGDFSGTLCQPNGGMVLSGNTLYGASENAIFKINTDGTGLAVLTNIMAPSGLALVGGTLYGIRITNESPGEVFSVSTNGTGLTVLHAFSGSDGSDPVGGLVVSNGKIYGTTKNGGTPPAGSTAYGTVFMLNTNGAGFSPIYTFLNQKNLPTPNPDLYDGAYPISKLVLSGNILYGTTAGDNTNTSGTLFGIDTGNTNEFIVVYNFNPSDTGSHGAVPYGDLILSAGTLYGTTVSGGTGPDGTVFSILDDGTGSENTTLLHSFGQGSGDGLAPYGGLVQKTASQ